MEASDRAADHLMQADRRAVADPIRGPVADPGRREARRGRVESAPDDAIDRGDLTG